MAIRGPISTGLRCALYNLVAVGLLYNVGMRLHAGRGLESVADVLIFPVALLLKSRLHRPNWIGTLPVLVFVVNPLLWGIAGAVLHKCMMMRHHRTTV